MRIDFNICAQKWYTNVLNGEEVDVAKIEEDRPARP
jgi:hypothetical protein